MASTIGSAIGAWLSAQVHASTRDVAARAVLSIGLLSTTSGCSFLFVRGPPDAPPPGKAIHCSTSRVAPVLDSIFAGLEVARVGIDAASSDAQFQGAPINRGTDIALGAAFGVLFAVSAGYGFTTTDRCSRALHGEPAPSEPTEPAEPQQAVAPAAASASAVPTAPAQGPRSFDQQAARAAIEAGIARAESKCHPTAAQGKAMLTYEGDGHVHDVAIDPPMADRTVEDCIASALRDATIPAYAGGSVTVKKSFRFGP